MKLLLFLCLLLLASRIFDRPMPIVQRHFRPAKPPTSAKSAPSAGDNDKNAPDFGGCHAIISPFFRKSPQLRRPARSLRSPRPAASKKTAAAMSVRVPPVSPPRANTWSDEAAGAAERRADGLAETS